MGFIRRELIITTRELKKKYFIAKKLEFCEIKKIVITKNELR